MTTDIAYLSIDLPENVQKAKAAGDFAFAVELIDAWLETDCEEALRNRLLLERQRIGRIARQYPYTRQQAIQRMQGLVPDFTEQEFDALVRQDAIDFWYKDGQRMYFEDFAESLLIMQPSLARRSGKADKPVSPREESQKEIRKQGGQSRRITLHAGVRISDRAFVPGEQYTVHIPLPSAAAQQSDIRILRTSHAPLAISPEDAPQRTVCFCQTLTENEEFFVEYSYTTSLRYFDADNLPAPGVLYPQAQPPREEDLQPLPPHIRFSPYLQALLTQLKGEETRPVQIARRIYDLITTRVRYSYMREYLQIDDGGAHVLLDRRGDCGLQALAFITLCRMAGIPARWQSGLYVEPGDEGSHDWAQFYVAEYGWLFADPSFGGGGARHGDEERRRFYFGNVEGYRMAANSAYQADFAPAKRYLRADPFDNQCGEVETQKEGLRADQFRRILRTLPTE